MFDLQDPCCSTGGLKPYAECLALLAAEAEKPEQKIKSISEAIGHVVAADIKAPMSVPSFDNSAMDGFAFLSSTVAEATSTRPVQLPIVGASIAGDFAGKSHLGKGSAVKIMTGAPMPEGADTILPVEAASWSHEKLTFYKPYPKGRHVRQIGQDIEKDSTLLKAGTRLEAHHIPMLCSVGLGKIAVHPSPDVAWISTGQEICDDLSTPLDPGHIYNATRLYGHAIAEKMGVKFISATTVRDTPQDFAMALEQALDRNPKIILSTGGVSAGQYDFVKPVLKDLGAHIVFHKARIKPAKPILFARLPNGTFFFGLPGNPISTALALRAVVEPFVRSLIGLPAEPAQYAQLDKTMKTDPNKTVFLMGHVYSDNSGQLHLRPLERQQSFQTAPFARSNAWAIIPENTSTIDAGSIVQILPHH